jgi:hypothetical protein
MNKLINNIEDIKEKLSSKEYLDIMNNLMDVYNNYNNNCNQHDITHLNLALENDDMYTTYEKMEREIIMMREDLELLKSHISSLICRRGYIIDTSDIQDVYFDENCLTSIILENIFDIEKYNKNLFTYLIVKDSKNTIIEHFKCHNKYKVLIKKGYINMLKSRRDLNINIMLNIN